MTTNDILGQIAQTLAAVGGVDPTRVTPATTWPDLDIDSMTLVEIVVSLEDRFGLLIDDTAWSQTRTVGDLLDQLERAGVAVTATG